MHVRECKCVFSTRLTRSRRSDGRMDDWSERRRTCSRVRLDDRSFCLPSGTRPVCGSRLMVEETRSEGRREPFRVPSDSDELAPGAIRGAYCHSALLHAGRSSERFMLNCGIIVSEKTNKATCQQTTAAVTRGSVPLCAFWIVCRFTEESEQETRRLRQRRHANVLAVLIGWAMFPGRREPALGGIFTVIWNMKWSGV